LGAGLNTTEDIATSDHDPNLDPQLTDLLDLVDKGRDHLLVDSASPVATENLATQLEQDPLVLDLHVGGCSFTVIGTLNSSPPGDPSLSTGDPEPFAVAPPGEEEDDLLSVTD
jgi:hypothetical protein